VVVPACRSVTPEPKREPEACRGNFCRRRVHSGLWSFGSGSVLSDLTAQEALSVHFKDVDVVGQAVKDASVRRSDPKTSEVMMIEPLLAFGEDLEQQLGQNVLVRVISLVCSGLPNFGGADLRAGCGEGPVSALPSQCCTREMARERDLAQAESSSGDRPRAIASLYHCG
jgi:hypothetical protein